MGQVDTALTGFDRPRVIELEELNKLPETRIRVKEVSN